MDFTSNIVVRQDVNAVSRFLADPANLVKWDLSVAQVEAPGPGPIGSARFCWR
jgi:hypothetical protein